MLALDLRSNPFTVPTSACAPRHSQELNYQLELGPLQLHVGVPSTFGLLRAARGGIRIAARDVPPMLFARKSKGDSEVLRQARVRQLFETLLSEELTETGVLLFYRWLKKYHPELLVRKEQDDPYEHLRMELEGLYK